MPLDTINAFRDHGTVDCRAVTERRTAPHKQITALEQAGISMASVTAELSREGIAKFCAALHSLLDTINERQGQIITA